MLTRSPHGQICINIPLIRFFHSVEHVTLLPEICKLLDDILHDEIAHDFDVGSATLCGEPCMCQLLVYIVDNLVREQTARVTGAN